PKQFRRTMQRLVAYLQPFRATLAVVLVFAIASTVFAIVSPRILGNITNEVVYGYTQERAYDQFVAHLPPGTPIRPGTTGADLLSTLPPDVIQQIPESQRSAIAKMDLSHRPGIDFAAIRRSVELLIGLYLLSAFFGYVQAWLMAGVAQRVTFDLRRGISLKFDRLPLRYFDTRTHGEVLSRVTNDVETVSQTLTQSLTQIVTSATTIVGILVMMLSISWQLTLVALLILPLSFGFMRLIIGRSQRYFVQQQVSLGRLNGHVEEMFSGHTVMKAFGGEKRSIAAFRDINSRLYESAWKSQFLSGLMFPIMLFVGNLGYVAVAVLGGWLAIRGQVRIGDIQAFIQYMNQFTQPVTQTANVANVLQSTAAAAERVFEFLDEPEHSTDPATPMRPKTMRGEVEFDHVVFGYDPETPIIKDFSAHILPGQRVAIVGPTGAGKTTIVNLLMRFYDPNQGEIRINGVPTREMSRAEVRRLFGMVLQDSWLFTGTIEENIAYGNPRATPAEIRTAAEAAHADHFIRALPGGYQMELNEEADNVSAGEKQLLTIARAMLADAPMLILDEATSSVDTRTEALIQAAMERLMTGRTSFVIAHRLSTIRNADLILVMRDGNIVEQGTHADLLTRNGFYADLYNSQFAGAAIAVNGRDATVGEAVVPGRV
ncbi:MAG TPA: ABC transporter ATP-binding protein, partial [Thermomicrobiales bacterium]|nr:ABC transporter ATP-binding protein [Thermomicrobiales bacterium]